MMNTKLEDPYVAHALLKLVDSLVQGLDYQPLSGLDDGEPIDVRITLGDYRRASYLAYALRERDG